MKSTCPLLASVAAAVPAREEKRIASVDSMTSGILDRHPDYDDLQDQSDPLRGDDSSPRPSGDRTISIETEAA